jgi:hypothetical protein
VVEIGGEKGYILNEVGKFRGGMSAMSRPSAQPAPKQPDDAAKSESEPSSEKKLESKKADTKGSADNPSEDKGK